MNRKEQERTEAIAKLREWIKPGDTVYTVLRHVSRSGMQREIGVVILKDGSDLHPNYSVAKALGERQGKRDGVIVGGCGMDMGFHLVHSLGYALFGEEASHGTGPEAEALRKAIFDATGPQYFGYNGKRITPDITKPDTPTDRQWFGAAGYALKHRWL